MINILRKTLHPAVALAKGFATTLKNMLRPTVTENYPDEKVNFEGRFRGLHILRRDENGLEKCVGCFLCSAACPSPCIYIEAADNVADHQISAGEAQRASLARSLISTTIDVFFVGIVLKPAQPMQSRMGMSLKFHRTMSWI